MDRQTQTALPITVEEARRLCVGLDPDGVPTILRRQRRWVCWNFARQNGKPKPAKVPCIPHRPSERASCTDATTWRTFAEAVDAVFGGEADGIEIATGDGLTGIDLDACRDPETGDIEPRARNIIDRLNSYTELSPSGRGIRIFARGTLPPRGRKNGRVEMYDGNHFLSVTGRHLAGTPETVESRQAELATLHREVFGGSTATHDPVPAADPPLDVDDTELLARARAADNGPKFDRLFAGDWEGYASQSEADLALCSHLAFWTGGDATRIDRLFRQSGLFREKWDRRHGSNGRTYGELTIDRAIRTTTDTYRAPARNAHSHAARPRPAAPPQHSGPPASEALILDPADPLPSARAFVERFHTIGRYLALRHQGGVFFEHCRDSGAYRERDEAAVRAGLYRFLEPAQTRDPKGKLLAFQPTKSKVENVLDALRAVCNLPSSVSAPCWLHDDPGLDPFDVLACRNGLLHIPTRRLNSPTPAFFTVNGLDFAYDANAPAPLNWLRFLDDLWPDDVESRETLQEVIGYLLTPRTLFHKIFMLVGPRRSGKGSIGRVVRRLLGERNVCGPTLANMGEPFGLSTLIGKSVAIIADARIGGRSDTAVIAEQLLSISGEDTRSIPRKYLPD
jgi:hypothetical protein